MYLVVKAEFIFGVHCLLVKILGIFFVLVCLCVIFRMGTIEILEKFPMNINDLFLNLLMVILHVIWNPSKDHMQT
jgi:hypothetical protein